VSKLSELVAVRVMGWHEVVGTPGLWYDGARLVGELPEFDTSIADAWRVVEKMGGTFDCGSPYMFVIQQAPAWARFGGNLVDPSGANTIPEAICLAALRACGVSDGEIEEARKQ